MVKTPEELARKAIEVSSRRRHGLSTTSGIPAPGSYVLFFNEFKFLLLIHLIVVSDCSVLLCFEVA